MSTISLSTKIRTLRTLRGWSQRVFAAKIGKSRLSVSLYETGDQKPRKSTLRKIEAVFDLALDSTPVNTALLILDNRAAKAEYVKLALALLEESLSETPRGGPARETAHDRAAASYPPF